MRMLISTVVCNDLIFSETPHVFLAVRGRDNWTVAVGGYVTVTNPVAESGMY